MSVEYRVINIGTLSHNRLWGETQPVRTAHATTTWVAAGDRRILVDPSLPGQILQARLHERTGQGIDAITDVFLTTLRPIHRRGLEAFPDARWWAHEPEIETYRDHLAGLADSAERLDEEQLQEIRAEQALVESIEPAPEELAGQVTLYPLIGPSPGGAGLLLTPPTMTVVIAGDAALTADHVRAGQVWAGAADRQAAMQCLGDMLELADVIIPGHDNVTFSPQRWL
jgi:glyoxylase-like metal-dependent hydrolase (beta-lactamase superfamily II)